MYHNYQGLRGQTSRVLNVVDGGSGEILEFGKVSGQSALSMLFCDEDTTKRGQVEVIAVPFRNGSHKWTSIGQAIQVVKWLGDMHKEGCVHGDIRGLNLIFSDENESVPIDFDFGGRLADEVKFPPGYATILHDGSRYGCKGGAPITINNDFRALKYVLVNLHRLKNARETERELLVQAKDMDDLLLQLQALENNPELTVQPTEPYGEFLDEEGGSKFPEESAGPLNADKTTPYGTQHTPSDMPVGNIPPGTEQQKRSKRQKTQ